MKKVAFFARVLVSALPMLVLIGMAEVGERMDTVGTRYFDRLMDWAYGHQRWRNQR